MPTLQIPPRASSSIAQQLLNTREEDLYDGSGILDDDPDSPILKRTVSQFIRHPSKGKLASGALGREDAQRILLELRKSVACFDWQFVLSAMLQDRDVAMHALEEWKKSGLDVETPLRALLEAKRLEFEFKKLVW